MDMEKISSEIHRKDHCSDSTIALELFDMMQSEVERRSPETYLFLVTIVIVGVIQERGFWRLGGVVDSTVALKKWFCSNHLKWIT